MTTLSINLKLDEPTGTVCGDVAARGSYTMLLLAVAANHILADYGADAAYFADLLTAVARAPKEGVVVDKLAQAAQEAES